MTSDPGSVRIALLRGVNVGGRNRLSMADFRALLVELGYGDVRSHIQSGNAVFRASGAAPAVAAQIAGAIETRFGFRPEVVMLSHGALRQALTDHPFAAAAARPATLHLFFAADGAVPDLEAMRALAAPTERVAWQNGVIYLHAPDGIGRSRLAARLPRMVSAPVTARNLRSCQAILDLADEIGG